MNIIDYKDFNDEVAREGCLVLNMPNEDYHNYPAISKSGLDLVNRSPAHYFFAAKFEPSAAMRMGTIIHTALLEPARFASEYVCFKDVDDKRKSEYKEAAKVHGKDKVLTASEATSVASLQESITSSEDCREVLKGCKHFEVSVFACVNGCMVKCRFDALNIGKFEAVDLKKTENSSRDEFAKSVYNYRYHVQEVFYRYVFFSATGRELKSFKFLAVEDKPPHCPMVYALGDEAKEIASFEIEKDMATYMKADSEQEWKGYEQTGEPLELPAWAVARYENELEDSII